MPRPKPTYKPIKPCSKCKIEKPLADFPISSRKYDGRSGTCKECGALYAKRRYHVDIDFRSAKKKYIREYNESGRRKDYRYHEKWRAYTARKLAIRPWQAAAHHEVNNAISCGRINRQPCQICGKEKAVAHHDSYLPDQYLNIKCFCRQHHMAWHRVFEADILQPSQD